MEETFMTITSRKYGALPDGNDVFLFELTNSRGLTIEIINYGGTIVSIIMPDAKDRFEDIVLGCDNLEDYLAQTKYFGATTGRFANRIEGGVFELNDKRYELEMNDGENHLHGGLVGFDKVLWDAEIKTANGQKYLELTYLSKDGEEGYPGNLEVTIKFTLSEENELKIDYKAISDRDTIVNLSNHSYFNLAGYDGGDIGCHQLMINSKQFTAVDEDCLTNGDIVSVEGTPFDFTELTSIGQGMQSKHEQIVNGMGYDHNWILDFSGEGLQKAAELYHPDSGRFVEVFTTKPGLQFYSGNFLDGTDKGKHGIYYKSRTGCCLETQFFPNSMKHTHFPSPILRAGDKYSYVTVYKFSTR